LYSLRSSSTNPGSILKQKKEEYEERMSMLETEGANIYSDILASPVGAALKADGSQSLTLQQR